MGSTPGLVHCPSRRPGLGSREPYRHKRLGDTAHRRGDKGNNLALRDGAPSARIGILILRRRGRSDRRRHRNAVGPSRREASVADGVHRELDRAGLAGRDNIPLVHGQGERRGEHELGAGGNRSAAPVDD